MSKPARRRPRRPAHALAARPTRRPRATAASHAVNVYPRGFIFGRGEASPRALSLAGLKIARALRALRPVRGRVLELGCGGGQYLRALRRRRPDLEIFAVDLDAAAVAATLHIPGVTACRADVAALPFTERSFTAVLGFDILEHVPRPKRVLAEAARVLVPGGLLHLYVPCEGNLGTVYQVRGHAPKARWGGHRQQFTTDQVVDLLTGAGLRVTQLRHTDYWLTQQLDYLFFNRLAKSPDPGRLWAAQALTPGGGWRGAVLRLARRLLSAASWLESVLRTGRRGAMGVQLTAVKK